MSPEIQVTSHSAVSPTGSLGSLEYVVLAYVTGHLADLDRPSHVTQQKVSERGRPLFSCSVVEATVTQLLVDSLADARHVLLTEQQRLLHRQTTAVLTDQDRKDKQ